MTLRPVFRKAARLEYDAAADWYEAHKVGLGRDFVAEIDLAVRRACESPDRFPLALHDVRRVRVRRFPYHVFFRTRSDRLIVLAVFHVRRDPLVLRERT